MWLLYLLGFRCVLSTVTWLFCLTMWLLYLLGFRCVLSSVTWLFLSDNVVAVPVGVQVCSVMCYLVVFV